MSMARIEGEKQETPGVCAGGNAFISGIPLLPEASLEGVVIGSERFLLPYGIAYVTARHRKPDLRTVLRICHLKSI